MESYCVNCWEEFYPIEGNSDREFCSYECEEEYFAQMDLDTEHYNYGRN